MEEDRPAFESSAGKPREMLPSEAWKHTYADEVGHRRVAGSCGTKKKYLVAVSDLGRHQSMSIKDICTRKTFQRRKISRQSVMQLNAAMHISNQSDCALSSTSLPWLPQREFTNSQPRRATLALLPRRLGIIDTSQMATMTKRGRRWDSVSAT